MRLDSDPLLVYSEWTPGTKERSMSQTVTQQAHAEFTDDGILVLFPNGEVALASTPAKALAKVQARDQECAKARVEPTILVTALTWHNCPDGFEPPEVK